MTNGIRTDTGITLEYASRGMRLLGQVVDSFIAMAPVFLFGSIAKHAGGPGGILTMLGAIWVFFYLILGDGLHQGQSFAKQWLGMRVVDAKTGEPCTFGKSFVRNIALSLLGPIDWLFIFGERHQRLGDKMAGTVVVMAD